jgi:hypothetical protein
MSYTANFGLPIQDPVDQLADKLDNSLKIYESTRYVGTGSLLMLSDGGEEQIIPQFPDDLSSVEPYLKVLPNPENVESLIDIYYKVKIEQDFIIKFHVLLTKIVVILESISPFSSSEEKGGSRLYKRFIEATTFPSVK